MAYNLLDLQSALLDDLKDPSFSTSRLTRYLNYGQLQIFNTHLFKFTEKAVTGALTVGASKFDQQSDWQATIGGVLTDPTNVNRQFELNSKTYLSDREFFERFPDPSVLAQNMPGYWTEFASYIYFNCPLDKAYTFAQRYYRIPVSMSAPTDVPTVPESFREAMETYALMRCERYRGNYDIASMLKPEFEELLEAMNIRHATNQVAAPVMRGARRRVNA